MINVKREIRKLKRQFNHIGLYGDADMCRLIGFADSEEDYYYILIYPNCRGEKAMIHYNSMVGPFVSLKYRYPRYKQLDNLMTNVWNCPPQKEFRIEKTKEINPFEGEIK